VEFGDVSVLMFMDPVRESQRDASGRVMEAFPIRHSKDSSKLSLVLGTYRKLCKFEDCTEVAYSPDLPYCTQHVTAVQKQIHQEVSSLLTTNRTSSFLHRKAWCSSALELTLTSPTKAARSKVYGNNSIVSC